MALRPPSLRAIAAFEAAARHQSFTRAAEELNLTQSAISHAIRGLEQRVGAPLFLRFGRAVALTDQGQTFLGRVRVGLNLISEAVDSTPRQGRQRLSVALQEGVGDRLVAPRLARFTDRAPDCQLDLRRGDGGGLASGDIDVVVRFGPGGSPGYPAHILALDSVVAVAAPGLGGGALPRWPEDLARFPLIHQAELPWSLWLERAGLPELPPAAGVEVDDLGMGIGLAKAGLGVALAPEMLVRSELQAGGLVRLFERAPVPSDGYQATWNPGSPKQSIIRTFVDWLRAEIDASRVEHFAERAAGMRAYG